MHSAIVVIQVLSALAIIGLVLLQHGKGADMGAAFGSGASGSLFGASGSSNFLSKSTGLAAVIFFGSTLALAYLGNKQAVVSGGVMENLPAAAAPASKAASVPDAKASAAIAASAAAAKSTSAPASAAGQAGQIPK